MSCFSLLTHIVYYISIDAVCLLTRRLDAQRSASVALSRVSMYTIGYTLKGHRITNC